MTERRLILATRNAGKVGELRAILGAAGLPRWPSSNSTRASVKVKALLVSVSSSRPIVRV